MKTIKISVYAMLCYIYIYIYILIYFAVMRWLSKANDIIDNISINERSIGFIYTYPNLEKEY